MRILLGTQMIAKGLDFPNVTLVGVINADTALHLPDFRAAERTFQLVTQVAGRTGRGEQGGRVLVQTFSPDTPAIQAAVRHDYAAFARERAAASRGGRLSAVCVDGAARGSRRERSERRRRWRTRSAGGCAAKARRRRSACWARAGADDQAARAVSISDSVAVGRMASCCGTWSARRRPI